MPVLETAFKSARANPRRVVLPELDEPRIAAAAQRLRDQGLAEPVPPDPADEAMLEALMRVRPMKPALARRLLGKPMYRAAAMVALDRADAMIAGAATPTRRVIEAARICIGLDDDVEAPSSFFLISMPDGRQLILADCALTVSPDARTLAGIAKASARSALALLDRAEVAMLSFSTGTSGAGASVELVREATRIAAEEGLTAIGPVQGDAALNPVVAAGKGAGSGTANVLIFPDLNSGNIAYKLLQELGGAQALGPFLQGFRRPVCDLSRGASVEDIVAATVLAVAMR